ncbi:MAG: DUF58 domain-containing protein [Nitrospirae bacterium]|uniref:DUF58 domain-containing protein n=1 Tax=Candidatus Magnetobacterium casense TaxID=1455061 RepID=UPI0005914055|nr:DUF58 domain-containing protein [Candidatus Magnetobacterium casensis]MBF0336766.1 DUF58 domain-containing protein [Nitrospirota bacterium]
MGRSRLLYYLQWYLSGLIFRINTRFTTAGKFAVVVMIFTGLLGIDVRHMVTYEIFTFLFVMIVSSMLYAMRFSLTVRVARTLPPHVSTQAEFSYKLLIEFAPSTKKKQQRGLEVVDILEDPRPTLREFLDSDGGERSPWRQCVDRTAAVTVTTPVVIAHDTGAGSEATLTITPQRRGKIVFKAVLIVRKDPLGLFRAVIRIPLEQSLIVLPQRYAMPDIYLSGGRMHNQGGVTMAMSVGESGEFYAMRDYAPGDPIRIIDWKSWAKTNKPVVRKYQEEFFSRHALVMDTFGEKGLSLDDVFEVCISIAASLIVSINDQDSLLDLIFVENNVYCFTTGRGLTQRVDALELLAGVRLTKDKGFDVLANSVKKRLAITSSLICVFIRYDSARKQLIDYLLASGLPLRVIMLCDKTDVIEELMQPPYSSVVTIIGTSDVQEGLRRLTGGRWG